MTNPPHNPEQRDRRFELDREYLLAELLAKEKADLEKLKLVAEMVSQRRRNRVDLIRAFMIPVLVAFLAWLSTSIITRSNQKETALNNDKRYVRDIDMEIRKTSDIEMHRLWVQRLQVFRNNHLDCTDAEILSILDENKLVLYNDSVRRIQDTLIARSKMEIAAKASVFDSIANKEIEVNNTQKLLDLSDDPAKKNELKIKLTGLTKQMNHLIESDTSAKKVFGNTEGLGDKTQNQIRSINPVLLHENTEAMPVLWFKEGNFLICFDSVKVVLNKIDVAGKTIRFSAYPFDKKNPQSLANPIIADAALSVGATTALNKRYSIKLVSIDHAGRNPLTMAAYVSFLKNTLAVAQK